ncbi:uncharacterized protein LOC131954945 [Physella acuta]|uniref:uncharacterized protein LOC131954945 n=1 Tax=Physella acuta TaxID=109671 RepID=UPI0027DAD23A|nr:uncharacterized protein LOC131954945 [Physella acuta]
MTNPILALDSACSMSNTINVVFKTEQHFISLGIELLYRVTELNTTLFYTTQKSNVGLLQCLHFKTFWIRNSTLEIECKITELILEVKIVFGLFVPICRIRVNGGRNVLKESSVDIFSNGQIVKNMASLHYKKALNGNAEDGLCFSLERHAKWESTFQWPRIIKQVVIHICETFTSDTVNFKIEFFNTGDQIKFIKIVNYFSYRYAINIVNSGEIVKIVLSSSETLAVSEFEVLGDCTKRRYGADCKEMCSITCADQDCQFNGVCKECVQKRTGDFCMESLDKIRFSENVSLSPINYIPTRRKFAFSQAQILTIIVLIIIVIVMLYLLTFKNGSRNDQRQTNKKRSLKE